MPPQKVHAPHELHAYETFTRNPRAICPGSKRNLHAMNLGLGGGRETHRPEHTCCSAYLLPLLLVFASDLTF